jgi:hypothetical protein
MYTKKQNSARLPLGSLCLLSRNFNFSLEMSQTAAVCYTFLFFFQL